MNDDESDDENYVFDGKVIRSLYDNSDQLNTDDWMSKSFQVKDNCMVKECIEIDKIN